MRVNNKNMASTTCYYGYVSGMLTAAALQPLDNIKMTLILPPNKLTLSSNFALNLYKAAKYLHIEQGLKSFYRGLVVNVWKTGLGSAFYFYALRMMEAAHDQKTVLSTFADSAAARVLSSAFTNPLSVAETRYQMNGSGRWEGNVLDNLTLMYRQEGVESLFKGCKASCLKEAGFAGMYYSLYQKGKELGLNSLVAGMSSGIVSTIATHPLEIVRTKNQSSHLGRGSKSSIGQQVMRLLREGKILNGVTPRLVKKPAANTISFLLFEYLEGKESYEN